MVHTLLNGLLEFLLWARLGGQSPLGGLCAGKGTSSEDEVGGALLAHHRGERRTSHRWIAAKRDFRKSPLGVFGGEAHVAHHGEFGRAAQAGAVHLGNGDRAAL